MTIDCTRPAGPGSYRLRPDPRLWRRCAHGDDPSRSFAWIRGPNSPGSAEEFIREW